MDDSIIAKRYAKAMFEIALESKIIERIDRELSFIQDTMVENKEWLRIIDDAKIPFRKKNIFIDEISKKAGMEDSSVALLKILADKKNVHLIGLIKENFKKERLKKEGVVQAIITVADERVFETLENEIVKVVEKISGKRAELISKIDDSIIGGLIIKIDDKIYDGSIVGDLKKLRATLMQKKNEIHG